MSKHGNVISKSRCPRCAKRGEDTHEDNLATYESGYQKCFDPSCGYYSMPNTKAVSSASNNPKVTSDRLQEIKLMITEGLETRDLPDRKVSKTVCAHFNYHVTTRLGEPVHIWDHYDETGNLVAQKVRRPGKKFVWLGDKSKATGFFGQHKYNSGKTLVITEGEIDAMSVAQVQGVRWPVVSLPDGTDSAEKAVKDNMQWLQGFEEFVLLMDNDKPGRKAIDDIADILPGVVKIATYPSGAKDTGDLLVAGRVEEIKQMIFSAKTHNPFPDMMSGSDFGLEEFRKVPKRGFTLKYKGLSEALRGIRVKELTIVIAGPGLGKTSFVKEISHELATVHEQRFGNIFLEEGPDKTVQSYACLHNSIKYVDYIDDTSIMSDEQIMDAKTEFIDAMTFMNHFGSIECDKLIKKIEYMATVLKVDFIVLDHISMVFSGLDTNDERKDIDNLMGRLRTVIQKTGVGIISIVHLKRKNGGESFNEGGTISLQDIRGSSSIEGIADNIIALERNQQAEDPMERMLTLVRLLKCRLNGEACGPVDRIKYDRFTGRLLPVDGPVSAPKEIKPEIPEVEFNDYTQVDQQSLLNIM